MTKRLPRDILVQIICRLPVTTILRCCQQFSCVKYTFDKIISDPMFPKLFQYHNTTRNNSSIIAYDSKTNSSILIDYDHDYHCEFRLENLQFFEDRTKIVLSGCNVVASCNGWLLVCQLFYHIRSCSVLALLRLVNPTTRRCVVLPETPCQLAWRNLNYGLGYGSNKTGLLKVVKLCQQYGSTKIVAEVLTIGTAATCSWEVMDTKCSIGLIRSKAVALNGALHWLVDDNLILRYDLDENKFEFVPKIMVVVSYLGVLDGMLCVGSSTIDGKAVEVWVMKEYGVEKSWTRFTVIHELDVNNASFQLIPELKDGKVLILTTTLSSSSRNFFLDVYDPKEKRRDRRVPLLEGIDEVTRGRMTVDHIVPSFLSLKLA